MSIDLNSPLYIKGSRPCKRGHLTPDGRALRYKSSYCCVYCARLVNHPRKGRGLVISGEVEARVLQLKAQGFTYKQIAAHCFLHPSTVQRYFRRQV